MTIAPIFLHLTHPYALQNLCVALKHVHRFKLFIKSLPAGEVNTRLAQTILVDSLDQSGIDFEGLIALLESSLEAVKKTESEFTPLFGTFWSNRLDNNQTLQLWHTGEPLHHVNLSQQCNLI